jgi:hypothetical protein
MRATRALSSVRSERWATRKMKLGELRREFTSLIEHEPPPLELRPDGFVDPVTEEKLPA